MSRSTSESAAPAWRQVLFGRPTHEVLEQLVLEDPLELRRLVAEGLSRGPFLLDAERVFLRSAARVAVGAGSYRGSPQLEAWLASQVESVLAELVSEAPAVESWSSSSEASRRPDCAPLAEPLGIEPCAAQRILREFNGRPRPDRSAFVEMVLRGRGFDSLGPRAVAIARRARATLLALLEAEQAPPTRRLA